MKFSQNIDWLWHIVEMLVMAAVFGCLYYLIGGNITFAAITGLAFGIGHFHGREKRDCEVKFNIPSPHLRSYWFGIWNNDQLTDFFVPALVGLAIIWSLS
jgi:hypothetical protein